MLKFARATMKMEAGQVIVEGFRGDELVICPHLCLAAKPVGVLRQAVASEEVIAYDPERKISTAHVIPTGEGVIMGVDPASPKGSSTVYFIVDRFMKVIATIDKDPRGNSILRPAYTAWKAWKHPHRGVTDEFAKLFLHEWEEEKYHKLAREVWQAYDTHADEVKNAAELFSRLTQESYPEALQLGYDDDLLHWRRVVKQAQPHPRNDKAEKSP